MNIAKTILACSLGLALTGAASAQIYESEDAEGVTEFSDTPTAGAQEVELQQTNVATPVEGSAPQAAPEQEVRGSNGEAAGDTEREREREQGDPDYMYYGGDYNNDKTGPREQRREDADRIEERSTHVDNSLPREDGGEAREGAGLHEGGGAAHGGGGGRR